MRLKFKRLHERASLPVRANDMDAGLDLVATTELAEIGINGSMLTYGTGLAVEIPRGYVGLLFPRSSVSTRTSLSMANSVGVIDAGYRGEILVKFRNHAPAGASRYRVGDKIAQLVVVPLALLDEPELVDELSDSERGVGGFGSSGV